MHVNQIQVIGSHNSYHAGFAPSERKYLEERNPKTLRSLDYHHAPLARSAGRRCATDRDRHLQRSAGRQVRPPRHRQHGCRCRTSCRPRLRPKPRDGEARLQGDARAGSGRAGHMPHVCEMSDPCATGQDSTRHTCPSSSWWRPRRVFRRSCRTRLAEMSSRRRSSMRWTRRSVPSSKPAR